MSNVIVLTIVIFKNVGQSDFILYSLYAFFNTKNLKTTQDKILAAVFILNDTYKIKINLTVFSGWNLSVLQYMSIQTWQHCLQRVSKYVEKRQDSWLRWGYWIDQTLSTLCVWKVCFSWHFIYTYSIIYVRGTFLYTQSSLETFLNSFTR